MVKHNNVLPNQHFKKHWQTRVRVFLDQPARQQRRRLKRQEKAKKIAPRPVGGALKPVVQCQTQRYNMKSRLGRGFTPMELKAAGINVLLAPTIGISVDKRRKNRSQEGLDRNVLRLKDYMSKLIVFPKKKGKFKNGDSSPEELSQATQVVGKVMPLEKKEPEVQYAAVTKEMQEYGARKDLKMSKAFARTTARKKCTKYGKEE